MLHVYQHLNVKPALDLTVRVEYVLALRLNIGTVLSVVSSLINEKKN